MTYSRQLTKNGHTNRLRNSPFVQIAQIVRIARLNSLTNRIVLLMARLLWVFWRIRMCIFRARVRHTGPTDFLAWWIGHSRVPETLTFKTGLSAKPLLCKRVFICMRIKKLFSYLLASGTWLRFETEAWSNSEMAYYLSKFLTRLPEETKSAEELLVTLIAVKFCSWRCKSPYFLLRIEVCELDRSNPHVNLLQTW